MGLKLVKLTEDEKMFNEEAYQLAVGCFLYLSTKTQPDISYVVGNVARFITKPNSEHWTVVKGIMRYLNRIIKNGLLYKYKNET